MSTKSSVGSREYFCETQNYHESWRARSVMAANLVPICMNIFEFGCGPYGGVRNFFSTRQKYLGSELGSWTNEIKIVYVETKGLPILNPIEGKKNVCLVALGVLEYLE